MVAPLSRRRDFNETRDEYHRRQSELKLPTLTMTNGIDLQLRLLRMHTFLRSGQLIAALFEEIKESNASKSASAIIISAQRDDTLLYMQLCDTAINS